MRNVLSSLLLVEMILDTFETIAAGRLDKEKVGLNDTTFH